MASGNAQLISASAAICERAHAGQFDKEGRPYVEHVRRVASYVDPDRSASVHAAALLHDVLEDSSLTVADLANEGIPPDVLEIVLLLTRRRDVADANYYRRIRAHVDALEVKLADLADNTDPGRLAQLGPADRARLTQKYGAAYAALGVDPTDGARRRQQIQISPHLSSAAAAALSTRGANAHGRGGQRQPAR